MPDRVVDPEYEPVRLARELSDAELRDAPRACRTGQNAVPLDMAEAICRVASGGRRLQDMA